MTDLAWAPAIPVAALVAVIAAEVTLALRGGRRTLTARSAAGWAAAYASLAVLFGLATAISSGWTAAGQFYTGYLTEYSLSLDNLFIFYVIMTRLAVPSARQHRVLMAGIALALVLRSVLIVAGTTAVSRGRSTPGCCPGWTVMPARVPPILAARSASGPCGRRPRRYWCWPLRSGRPTCCSRSTRSRPSSASLLAPS